MVDYGEFTTKKKDDLLSVFAVNKMSRIGSKMDVLAQVRNTLKSYEDEYRAIYENVEACCGILKSKMGAGVINSIYGRSGANKDRSIFKEESRIVEKLIRKKLDVTINNIIDLSDVIGITVVIYYSDSVDDVIERLCRELRSHGMSTSEPEKHLNKKGYYATHVVAAKEIEGGTYLKCEIQLKSMLHNAWAAKMHDLTYKPLGFIDPKTAALMASIAGAIENLEIQSQIVRDLIVSNWDVEAGTRREARHELFTQMLIYRKEVWRHEVPEDIVALSEEVERNATIIAADANASVVKSLMAAIRARCVDDGQIRTCWILSGRLASLRSGPDLSRWFAQDADRWLSVAAKLLKDKKMQPEEHSEISCVPTMFYVIGDLDKAIETATFLLESPRFKGLGDYAKLSLSANRVMFQVEKEYYYPTQEVSRRTQLKDEYATAIEEILSNPLIAEDKDVISSIRDTRGLHAIAFGDTPEEITQGIKECIEAVGIGTEKESAITKAYGNLNVRLGWRRYFDLERTVKGSGGGLE